MHCPPTTAAIKGRLFRPWTAPEAISTTSAETLPADGGMFLQQQPTTTIELPPPLPPPPHHWMSSLCPSSVSHLGHSALVFPRAHYHGTTTLLSHHTLRLLDDVIGSRTGRKSQRPKRFQCPHCHVAFSNNGQLKGHVRIHTGERPFRCDNADCGKTFTRNEELTRHKRIHSGVRPFACGVCAKKFGRKDHLKKHVKTHVHKPTTSSAAASVGAPPLTLLRAPPPPTFPAPANYSELHRSAAANVFSRPFLF